MAKRKLPSPFLRFNSSPEVIRLVVMMYVEFPLSLRNLEDLLHERGIDVAMRRYAAGGTASGRCSPRRSAVSGLTACASTPTGGGTSTRFK